MLLQCVSELMNRHMVLEYGLFRFLLLTQSLWFFTQLGLFWIVKRVGRGDLDLLHSPLQKRPLVLSRLWMAG